MTRIGLWFKSRRTLVGMLLAERRLSMELRSRIRLIAENNGDQDDAA